MATNPEPKAPKTPVPTPTTPEMPHKQPDTIKSDPPKFPGKK